MSDLIRREDALGILEDEGWVGDSLRRIHALPAVQPAHVSKTPKSEHVPGDVLTPATKGGRGMTDIKSRLGHIAVLANGPILNWPHLADVATEAIDRIASLEAQVRFLERKAVDPVPNHKRSPMEHEHDEE